MRHDVIALLNDAARKTNLSKEIILTKALQFMLCTHRKYLRKEGRIKYQDRFDEKTGLPVLKKRVKLSFWQKEYDYFQDTRKFFGRSISFVMAIAVFEYLDLVIEELGAKKIDPIGDNYPFYGYAWIEKRIENFTTFHIWWGIPEKLELMVT